MLPRSLEEAKQKSNHYNSLYTSLLHTSTSLHATYLQIHLPRVTTALLDAFENARSVMGRCLERFGKAKEEQVMGEAVVVSPLEGVGIRGVKLEEVDWSGLETSVPSLPLKSGSRNSLSLGRRNSVSLAPRSSLSLNPFGISRNSSTIIVPTSSQFGKSLDEITDLTSDQVPTLVQNCIDYIQSTGLYQEGIYRVSGNSNQISTLKQALDINPGLALEEVVKDVNSVTGVLKLFFREMKDTLIPRDLFLDFVNAASI